MTTYNHVSVRGLEVFYREAGPKDAPTIVLLHGFPSSSHMFRELIPRLAGRFHVIAPDYIGFGYSAHPAATEFQYTFDSVTEYVEKLLFDVIGLRKFSICVQDYGAPSASTSSRGTRKQSRASSSRTATRMSKGSAPHSNL
jgi:pimeloyl-ACP methyl ester carboxylesterase